MVNAPYVALCERLNDAQARVLSGRATNADRAEYQRLKEEHRRMQDSQRTVLWVPGSGR